MSGVVGIRLLGPRLFTVDGRPWRFAAPPRTVPLLGYLVTAQSAVQREQLAAALWPDVDDEEARANLRRHLHQLQQALPPTQTPWILTGPDGIRWNGDASVDVIEFERAHAAGDHARAVEHYGGEFLEGCYDDWIIAQRERLSAAFLADLEALLANARSKRDYPTAIALAQRILQLDEWREDALRALMSVRYEAGDRAGALGAFERFARKIADEMRVEPMPETRALRDAILRNAPVSVAAENAGSSPVAIDAPLPIVGRSNELARLRALWESVGRRGGGVAFVSGEAGIGKTRLVHEFALEVERQGGRVLIGHTTQHEPAPYEALGDALRSAAVYLADAQLDPLWLRVLASIVPELHARHNDMTAPEAIGEAQERTRLFEAIRRAVAALGKARPFLMVLEDVHWAGNETADALAYVARHYAGICGIVLATYRDDEQPQCVHLERVRRSLERDRRAIHVQPARLSQGSIAELVSYVPAMQPDAPRFSQRLHRISEGNPLFVVQLLRDFHETGHLPDEGMRPSADISETIAARIGRLSESAVRLAEHAAVAGRTFSIDLLRDATGWSEDQVLAALSELIDRHFIRASPESSRYHYAFSHNLVQLAIYAQIPARVRERLHHRMAVIAESAEGESAALAGEAAQHWDRAGDAQRAAAAYLRAADHAFTVYANETARSHALRALELGEGHARYRALRQLVAADERLGDKEAWAQHVDALLQLAPEAGTDEHFDALACSSRRLGTVGDVQAQREVLEQMKRVARASGKPEQLARTLIDEGALLWRRGDADVAQRLLHDALRAAREAGDVKLQLQARLALVHALMYAGEVDKARLEIAGIEADLGAEALVHDRMALRRAKANAAIVSEDGPSLERYANEYAELAARVGDMEAEAEAHRFLAYAGAYRNDLEELRDQLTIAAERFDRTGSRQPLCAVLIDLAAIEVDLGRYDEGERRLDELAPLMDGIDWPGGMAIALLNRAAIWRARSEYAKAQRFASQALDCAQRMQDPRIQSTALSFLGYVECGLGDTAGGLAHLRDGIALRRTTKQDWSLAGDLCLLIEALLGADDLDAAREAAEELERIYEAQPEQKMDPLRICWTLARVRQANADDAGSRAFIERGRALLEARCAAFKDPEIRAAYAARPYCRELLDAEWTPTAYHERKEGATT